MCQCEQLAVMPYHRTVGLTFTSVSYKFVSVVAIVTSLFGICK